MKNRPVQQTLFLDYNKPILDVLLPLKRKGNENRIKKPRTI